jgi:predicted RNA-binding Zn-ribbon protein involved in translation (DUF1610 family)
MDKGLFDRILDDIFDEQWVGRRGEKLTERELKIVRLFGRKGKVLRNVYVPKENGETSEIDVIYITQKGIFVFESKNYSGWIFGDEKSQYWMAMLPNKIKNQFYNPIKQNRTHLKWLGRYLGDDIPLFSLIVFSERCELKKITVESPDVKVIKRDRIYATVRSIWESTEDRLTEEQVNELFVRLKNLTNVDQATKEAHIASINNRYKKEKTETVSEKISEQAAGLASVEAVKAVSRTVVEIPEKEIEEVQEKSPNQLICPRCGSELILRTARKGENAGNQFYGCSSFPKCRYTQTVG